MKVSARLAFLCISAAPCLSPLSSTENPVHLIAHRSRLQERSEVQSKRWDNKPS